MKDIGQIVSIKGYFSVPLGLDMPDILIAPSANMIFRPNNVLESFPGCALSVSNGGGTVTHLMGRGYAALGLNETTDRGSGNALLFQNYVVMFTATGTVRVLVPEVSGSLTTIAYPGSGALHYDTTIPQICVRDFISGGYKAPRQIGIAPVSDAPLLQIAPVIGSGFSGKLSGSYSTVVTALRSDTGDESLQSPPSNVVSFNNNTGYYTFPSARTDGCDGWRVYFTYRNFGTVGGYQFFLDFTETTVAASTAGGNPRTIEFEFLDNELKSLQPPTDAFAPTGSADFIFSLANIVGLVGTYNGLGISFSTPGHAGNYPPENAQFIPEKAIGIISRPQTSYIFIYGYNMIAIAVLTGATTGSPVAVRVLPNNIGVANAQAATSFGDSLYFYTSGGQPARITQDGNLDLSFANSIKDGMAGWDKTKVRVTLNELTNSVLYTHDRSTFVFHIDEGRWSPPIILDNIIGSSQPIGNIVSAFYLLGKTYISTWNTNTSQYDLWIWDEGIDGSNYIIQHGWTDFNKGHFMKDIKTIIHDVYTPAGGTITGKIFKNSNMTDGTEVTYSFTVSSGIRISALKEPNVPEAKNISLRLTGSGYHHKFFGHEIEYTFGRMRN